MSTVKVEALRIEPEFYCTQKGDCKSSYVCINPIAFVFDRICPHLVVRTRTKKIVERIELEKSGRD